MDPHTSDASRPATSGLRQQHHWLVYATTTTLCWGVWGALVELPEKAGFPATLGYSVWALTMIPCALVALRINAWRWEWDRGRWRWARRSGSWVPAAS